MGQSIREFMLQQQLLGNTEADLVLDQQLMLQPNFDEETPNAFTRTHALKAFVMDTMGVVRIGTMQCLAVCDSTIFNKC